jgi:NadR type nicotinamide-nucleotide adenylyltransferase
VSARFARGLVVGKFSPLHRGHEQLLSFARSRCERLLCISYSRPELFGCDAALRRRWLDELFPDVRHLALDEAELQRLRGEHPDLPALPSNDASELEHRQFVAELCLQLLGGPVDAVFTSEHYGDGFAAELTRKFREAGALRQEVQHVLVDLERKQVPISASALRADPTLLADFVAPVVYASFVPRICLLGGESSGKTTLARALARSFETTHAEEFGRELWVARGGRLSFDDFSKIAKTQVEWEERAARSARRFVFCDSSPLTTLLYCLDEFGRAEPELFTLAERRYALTLLCAPDIPFVQDGTRRDAAFRARQHQQYLHELELRGIPHVSVAGPLESRLLEARRALERLFPA